MQNIMSIVMFIAIVLMFFLFVIGLVWILLFDLAIFLFRFLFKEIFLDPIELLFGDFFRGKSSGKYKS